MPKIFTSRYSNPELASGNYTVVGVTRSAPKFPLRYDIAGNIMDIAPPGWLFGENDRDRFTPQYFKNADRIGTTRIRAILDKYLSLGKDVVLCCYEDVRKPDEWCHRLVFAEWWESRTGEKIEELIDPSELKIEKPKVKKTPDKPLSSYREMEHGIQKKSNSSDDEFQQMTLF